MARNLMRIALICELASCRISGDGERKREQDHMASGDQRRRGTAIQGEAEAVLGFRSEMRLELKFDQRAALSRTAVANRPAPSA
jgi:hypothetical protein